MTYTRCTLILGLNIAALLSAASANEKDNEAKALVQKASDLSDIRKEGGPSFRLKANLRITSDDGSVVQGAYTEFWVSNAQWRKEMVLGEFRRTQVAMGRKGWTLDSSSIAPNRIADLETPFEWTLGHNPWKTDKFEDQQVDGIAARCFRTKREMWGVSELCFDKTSGTLLAKIDPVRVKNKTVHSTCIYRDYQRFGDRLVATSYQCFEDKKVRLQAKLGELTMRPELDQTLFAPLLGGKEFTHCLSRPQAPTVIQAPTPAIPPRKGDEMVTLSLLVGTDGRPRELQVIGSVDNDYDEAALEAVRQWRFKPASCDGQPTEVKIEVEVDFHYH